MHRVGCLHCWTNDARSHKHQAQMSTIVQTATNIGLIHHELVLRHNALHRLNCSVNRLGKQSQENPINHDWRKRFNYNSLAVVNWGIPWESSDRISSLQVEITSRDLPQRSRTNHYTATFGNLSAGSIQIRIVVLKFVSWYSNPSRGIQIRLVVFKSVSWYSNPSRGIQIRLVVFKFISWCSNSSSWYSNSSGV